MEIKSNPKNDGIAYSNVEEFVDLTMNIIRGRGIENRTMIQSFDKRALTRVHEKYPEVETSFLVFASDPKDRKSTRLNSSHVATSYAVFCLKKNQPAFR